MTDEELEMEITSVIESGNVEETHRLLEAHPNFLHHDYGMGTWLHLAARESEPRMIEMLVQLGCNVNAEMDNSTRDRPLFCALVNENPAVIEALLRGGADLQVGEPVITAIAGRATRPLEIVQLLDRYGANLHATFDFATGKRVNALSTALDWQRHDVAAYLTSRGAVMPEAVAPDTAASGIAAADAESAEADVVEYFAAHFGPVHPAHVREIVPTGLPISIHIVPPTYRQT